MPPKAKQPAKRAAKIPAYVSPFKQGPAAQTSQRRVFGAGVPGMTVHLLATRGDAGVDQRTLCGNWPGRPADMEADRLCPVCFKDA